MATRPYGMHPDAWAAFQAHGLPVRRVLQAMTVPGHAVAASAGTHDQDGVADGHPYAVCVDLSVRGLDAPGVHALVSSLADAGFAGFDRPPDWDGRGGGPHVHALWAAATMKQVCRHQVHDWLHGLDGLARHRPYDLYHPTPAQCGLIRAAFLAHNPAED